MARNDCGMCRGVPKSGIHKMKHRFVALHLEPLDRVEASYQSVLQICHPLWWDVFAKDLKKCVPMIKPKALHHGSTVEVLIEECAATE